MEGWGIGYVAAGPDDHGIVVERGVASEEVKAVVAARDTLHRWLLETPYQGLAREGRRFMDLVTQAALLRPGTESGALLQSALASWLSKFRSFDDHLAHQVSREYGKDSAEVAAWREATRTEFDSNFAYRFCYKLRNYAQHAAQPIQRVHFSHGGLADGTPEYSVAIEFDPVTLLRDYDGWGAIVRKDLEGFGARRIDVISTLRSAEHSCRIAMAKLVVRETPRLVAACERIEEFGAGASPGRSPAFIMLGDTSQPSLTMKVLEVPLDVAAMARALMRDAPTEAMGPRLAVLDPRDFQ